MAEYSAYKETSNRHLRFKLQSLGRRLDELEEATKNLQKAEDELLDLQDKVIQAEGSNSSMLADVEVLRKRVLKIEGKDEEIRKAEELCQLMKEKLEEEESLTRELKLEIERLQKRMAELEKLEEAFGRSKNDCTQLCLSLNEEKNLTKKISTELEVLRAKVKELEQSEDQLDKTEQSLVSELEKLKSLALVFVNERKHFTEKEKQNEKLIQELTQKLEQNNKLNRADQTRNASNLLERSSNSILERNDLRIEVDLTSPALSSKETRRKGSLDYLKLVENETRNKSENQKNKNQEDNKVKDLNQEIEKLKTQIKHFESLEEELKTLRAKNNDLHDSYLSEQNKNKLLGDQLEELRNQMKKQKELENGEAEMEEVNLTGRVKHDRPKHRAVAVESTVSKHKSRELSPQHRRDRVHHREFSFSNESQSSKRVPSPNLNSRKAAKASSTSALLDAVATDAKRTEDKSTPGVHFSSQKDGIAPSVEVKKTREQPSVLSRYPPAAQEQKSWKAPSKPKSENILRSKVEKVSQPFNDTHHCKSNALEEKQSKAETVALSSEKGAKTTLGETPVLLAEAPISKSSRGASNGAGFSYRHHLPSEASPAEPTCSKVEVTTSASSRRQPVDENAVKVSNSQEKECANSQLEASKPLPLSKSWLISRSQEDLLQGISALRKEDVDQAVVASAGVANDVGLKSTSTRSKAVKLGSQDRFKTSDETRKTTSSSVELGIRREPISRDFGGVRGTVRTPPFENDKNASGEEESGRSSRAAATTTGLKSRRPLSEREALRSRAVIKPAIVEKDVKEIMGGLGPVPEANSEKQHCVLKTVSHKMTSSITIYPSEPVTPRTSTSETVKEQQQASSACSMRLVPNELSSGANPTSTPYEISVNKSNITLKVPETEKNGEPLPRSRGETVVSKSSITIKPSEAIERNSDPAAEAINWKSHSMVETNSLGTKHVTVRSGDRWRNRRGLQSLEDSETKAVGNFTTRSPYRSFTDPLKPEGTSARIYTIEHNSRRASASVNSWNTPELDSRRSKSSLSASEVISQRGCVNNAVTASPWNSTALTEENRDFVPSSRRKQFGSSEQLSWAETPRKRPDSKLELHHQLSGSRTEERTRWSKNYAEDH